MASLSTARTVASFRFKLETVSSAWNSFSRRPQDGRRAPAPLSIIVTNPSYTKHYTCNRQKSPCKHLHRRRTSANQLARALLHAGPSGATQLRRARRRRFGARRRALAPPPPRARQTLDNRTNFVRVRSFRYGASRIGVRQEFGTFPPYLSAAPTPPRPLTF